MKSDRVVFNLLIAEQEEIVRSKKSGEDLTWEDLAKMKYTWRVAMETLRIVPPIFGSFKKALKDIEFGGYLIPKGWQVSLNLSLCLDIRFGLENSNIVFVFF